jgi:hypothetical protein
VRAGIPVDVIEAIDCTEEVARESIRLLVLHVPECGDPVDERAVPAARSAAAV